jgi:DNA-directed RNA polymerase subunit omega
VAYIPLERMIDKNPSLYKLVLVAAERANQICEGSAPLIKSTSKKNSTIALEEIQAGKVRYELSEETKGAGQK